VRVKSTQYRANRWIPASNKEVVDEPPIVRSASKPMEGVPKSEAPQARDHLPGDTGPRHAQNGLGSRIEECRQVAAYSGKVLDTIQPTPVAKRAIKKPLILKA